MLNCILSESGTSKGLMRFVTLSSKMLVHIFIFCKHRAGGFWYFVVIPVDQVNQEFKISLELVKNKLKA